MEELKGTLKSTRAWAWTAQNDASFEKLKKSVVIDCEKGIKRQASKKLFSSFPLNFGAKNFIPDFKKKGNPTPLKNQFHIGKGPL